MQVAVIPCHNEGKHIASVVNRTHPYVDRIVVVDNASQDDTTLRASNAGAEVVSCAEKGMGRATRVGIARAVELGADILVTLDGDGQHDPRDIPALTSALERCDMAIGSRDWCQMPKYRRVGNAVLAWLVYAGAGYFRDTQCGLRAFTRDVAMHAVTQSPRFGCVSEMIIRARKAGYRIAEVPVSCTYHRNYRENSTMGPIRHGVEVALETIRWRWWEVTGL